MRRAIPLVCKCPISFYETSPTDATETLVSATFSTTVAGDRTNRSLTDFSRVLILILACSEMLYVLCVCCNGEIRLIEQHYICAGDRETSDHL
jgi:hypothetical protein